MSHENNGNTVVWFLAGAALGAAIALLYAPQSGRETRKFVRKKTEQSGEAVADAGKEILDRGREYYDKGRKLAGEAGELFARSRKMLVG